MIKKIFIIFESHFLFQLFVVKKALQKPRKKPIVVPLIQYIKTMLKFLKLSTKSELDFELVFCNKNSFIKLEKKLKTFTSSTNKALYQIA